MLILVKALQYIVMPAKAGIQRPGVQNGQTKWNPGLFIPEDLVAAKNAKGANVNER
jgi:hypothetical protein